MGKKLHCWHIYLVSFAYKHWRWWTGKNRMMGWCCGDCLDHPINWNYETKERK